MWVKVAKSLRSFFGRRGIALYFDDEVEAMVTGTMNKVIDVAYEEAYFFITERLIEAGFEEEHLDRVLNNTPEWAMA